MHEVFSRRRHSANKKDTQSSTFSKLKFTRSFAKRRSLLISTTAFGSSAVWVVFLVSIVRLESVAPSLIIIELDNGGSPETSAVSSFSP
jgi:hypothetical protein